MQGPKSIKPTILYNESKHSIFAMVGKAISITYFWQHQKI
jgi:hypothetical protein